MSFLQLANIQKTYYMSDELNQEVLKNLDAHFNKGEMVALLGESGCGKSTLLNILGGLDSEYKGSVIIEGKFMKDFTFEEMDDYRKAKVGIIFQGFNLIGHLTVLQNVLLPMKMADWSAAERDERARKLLKQLGLTAKHFNKLPNQLSGGQQQRVAIARALANDPDIILADEPTGNLDNETTKQIMEILQSIAENKKLVIIVTHSETVANKCTRVLKMGSGVIVSSNNNAPLKLKDVPSEEKAVKSISRKDLILLALANLKNKWRNMCKV
jgi:ABC-type lipoprotein export system ATPase subunit